VNESRGNWYLLTGFVIGVTLGLLYAWVISPVKYVDTEPASLRADFKDAYRALIASAYAATGDLERARARLALLGDPDPAQTLAAQAQRTLAEAPLSPQARALGLLAAALGMGPTPAPIASQTRAPTPATTHTPRLVTPTTTPTPTITPTPVLALNNTLTPTRTPRTRPSRTPTPTLTPLATATATATPPPLFMLQSSEPDCDPALGVPLLRVWVLDADGQLLSGVPLLIAWGSGQQEHFYTGLKPEISPGYADFELTPGVEYTLQVATGSQPAQHILSPLCDTTGEGYQGGWKVVFRQP